MAHLEGGEGTQFSLLSEDLGLHVAWVTSEMRLGHSQLSPRLAPFSWLQRKLDPGLTHQATPLSSAAQNRAVCTDSWANQMTPDVLATITSFNDNTKTEVPTVL